MPKPEWGAKHRCDKCDTRFYDLQRSPVICPNCQEPIVFEIRPELGIASLVESADDEFDKEIGIGSTIMKSDDSEGVLEDSNDVLDEGEEVSLDDIKNVTTEDMDMD